MIKAEPRTTEETIAAPTTSRIPSIVLAVAVVAFVVSLAFSPSPAVDLFWQMRTGQLIASTHAVPHHDTFSWTRYGHPWIVHEWAMCLLLWETFQAGGFTDVWLLEAGLLSIIFLTLYSILLHETRAASITAFCLTLWAAKISSPFISPRPHLFTYLFLIVTVGILVDARTRRQSLRMWLLVPICAVWANFHGGVILGVALIALFGICDLIQARISADHGLVDLGKRELLIAVCCALALSLNPYGWRIYEIFTQTVGNRTMPSFVSEWSALDFHDSLGLLFELLFAMTIAGLALTREPRRLAEIAAVALLAHASVTASRNVPLFAFTAMIVAGRHIQSAFDRVLATKGEERSSIFGPTPPIVVPILVAVAVMLQSALFAVDQMRSNPDRSTGLARAASTSFALHFFPAGAVNFIEAERFPAGWRMYNDYNLGSYLLWMMPKRKISMDTQTDVFFGKVLDDYARLDQQPFDWPSIIGRYNPDFVLMSASEPQAYLFGASPSWALVWADSANLDAGGSSNVLIFVRNTPANAAFIDRCRLDCPTLRKHPEMTAIPLTTEAAP